jgi:hypothetical protein
MARRAQSSLKPLHLLLAAGSVIALLVLGYVMLGKGGDAMAGLVALDVQEYLEGASALSGNTYKLEGTVDGRLDAGRSRQRLFSVQVGEVMSFVPVLVPAEREINIQRGQRYVFKVRVQENGLLEVQELRKV